MVTVPMVTVPMVTVPMVAVPMVTVPMVTVPRVTVPMVMVPMVTVPMVTVPMVTKKTGCVSDLCNWNPPNALDLCATSKAVSSLTTLQWWNTFRKVGLCSLALGSFTRPSHDHHMISHDYHMISHVHHMISHDHYSCYDVQVTLVWWGRQCM